MVLYQLIPKGCFMENVSIPVPTWLENSPFNKFGIPQAYSTTSNPL